MARPLWTGVLSFGLVTVPIALYSATESHGVSFRQIQRGTADRVRNKRVNERTGEEVAFGDIVKGFELAEGEYVIVEPDELEQISPGRSKTIEITGFVDLDQVAPIYFDTTYYIGPKGKEYSKVYRLLQLAMERRNRAGLAMFAMRGKSYLTAVKAEGGILTAHTMHFADEVRDPQHEVDNLPDEDIAVSDLELAAAEQLIDMLSLEWEPEQWHDTYSEQVRELVQAKAEGREIAASEGPVEATNVIDLMDILNRSLANAGQSPEDASDEAGDSRKPPASARAPKGASGKKSTSAQQPQPKAAAAHKTTSKAKTAKSDLDSLTKAELYKRATDLDIPHRSTMTRDQLQDALEHTPTGRGRHLRSA
ncbi:DNA end-binding protein Ku [Kitasatospora sp. MAA4]|uniref:non-homologous end joining protein Ku n=1 Tax=Kitasatospora sp. MAA4 TaxID=3035093 RepID=UPI002474E38A|nr:Ku protein [Kitasatospora sp. MAA4]MDH6133288.1 DNA end-binding protein Ku [Kitasatospora sp. MAA4]